MLVAVQFDRRIIPEGIVRQKDIGSPMTWTSIPARRKCMVVASPCGPAPTTATSTAGMLFSFEKGGLAVTGRMAGGDALAPLGSCEPAAPRHSPDAVAAQDDRDRSAQD